MGENSGTIQARLTALLTKFDAMDLHLTNLGKQIESTQENVDEIRHQQAEICAAGGGSTVTGGAMDAGTSSAPRLAPRLTNDLPPLLKEPDEQPPGTGYITAPASRVEPAAVTRVHEQEQVQERRRVFAPEQLHVAAPRQDSGQGRVREYAIKPPKHDFPRFTGENPNLWLDRALTYFEMYQVPPHQWVATATLYLDGHAALWWQAFKCRRRLWPWDDFAQQVTQEFGQGEFESISTT